MSKTNQLRKALQPKTDRKTMSFFISESAVKKAADVAGIPPSRLIEGLLEDFVTNESTNEEEAV